MNATLACVEGKENSFDAIAIGASAGGVEAIGTLLDALPPQLSAAVLVVLHLPPGRVSMLAKLFSRRSARPVKEAEDKEPISAGSVYLAPPDYHLLVEPGRSLALSKDELVNYSRPAIDLLLESAALAYRERLLGILLTGASSDGAAGLKQVWGCGGAAWVQNPLQAMAPTMPAAAIARCPGADVLGLDQIAQRLSRFA